MAKKILHVLCHAIAANTEKVQPVIQNFKARLHSDFIFQIIQTAQMAVSKSSEVITTVFPTGSTAGILS